MSTAHRSLLTSGLSFVQFNPSTNVPVSFAHTVPNHRQAPAAHTPMVYYRSASPLLTADTYCRQPYSPHQWYQLRSYCRRLILGNTALMPGYALPDSHFVENYRIAPCFCSQEHTDSSCRARPVSQDQIR